MNDRLRTVLDKMAQLDTEFHEELKSCEQKFQHCFVAGIDEIKRSADDARDKLSSKLSERTGTIRWRNIASAPFVYAMLIPLAFLDLSFFIYQSICFRLYKLALVKRSAHFIIDRQMLSSLSGIDKFNCVYCGYGNGVISYAREILSKTEQYWCPIKHAQKTLGTAQRYNEFLEYGEIENYHEKLAEYRDKLREEE